MSPLSFINALILSLSLLQSILIPAAAMSTSKASKPIINHLLQRTTLHSQFYALRHGQSLANVAQIISSDPLISTKQHGLSEVGKGQAIAAGEAFASSHSSTSTTSSYQGVAIFSSDFTRARETASLFAEQLTLAQIPLYNNDIILEPRLRERYFGELNGGPDTRYQNVWDVDIEDANHEEFGVESANSVLERTSGLVLELDDLLHQGQQQHKGGEEQQQQAQQNQRNQPWKCILVAHGDVLQILQTGFLKHEDAKRHRSLEHLETATIRELILPSS